MKRYPYRNVVTPDVALAVLNRDKGCVAVALGASPAECRGRLTLDHVKDQPRVGDPLVKRADRHSYRAPSDERHLVAICYNHHLGSGGWATSHRPELRAYLRSQAERTPDVTKSSASEGIGSTTRPMSRSGEGIERA